MDKREGARQMSATCTVNETHCENCGSTDYEDTSCGDQGYSACCNEVVVWGPTDCRNHHGEVAPTEPAACPSCGQRGFHSTGCRVRAEGIDTTPTA
jgi:hypothetical protein